MTVPAAPDLERLVEVAALERPAEAKRMLVIVNPYATTMSDRLKHLVVYALQGRYDVTAIDTQRKGHAIELVAEAAREGSDDVVDATEHLLGLPDRWEPRAVDLGRVNGRAFTFAAGMGLDASVVERVEARPEMKRRFGHWYFTEKAVGTFMRKYVVRPPKLSATIDGGEPVAGVSVFFQNGQPYTYFKERPVNLTEGARLDSGDLAGVVLTRANPVDVPTVLFRALSDATIPKHRRVEAFEGAHEVVIRSGDGRPVPWQVDGDHVGDDDEVRVTVDPGALRIVA